LEKPWKTEESTEFLTCPFFSAFDACGDDGATCNAGDRTVDGAVSSAAATTSTATATDAAADTSRFIPDLYRLLISFNSVEETDC